MFRAALTVLLFAVLLSAQARADERLFTYSYDVVTMAPGDREYEQYITWKTDKDDDAKFDRIDFRHEIEFGLTDRLQLGIYLSDWRYEDGRSVEDDGAEWRNAAIEAIYNLTSPTTDPIGLALYGEVKWGDELFVLEAKLLVQKNIGPWVFIWNGIFEAEWESKDYDEDKAEFGNTFGISYQVSPQFSIGAELVHEIEYADWSEWEDHVVYAGPNFAFRFKTWWITITPMVQLTDVEGEANFQTRVLIGFGF